jgi:outer membrane protein assembly factor BamB
VESDGKVYAGAADRRLYCLDAASGKQLWSNPLSEWVRARPLAIGNRVYAAAMDGRLRRSIHRAHFSGRAKRATTKSSLTWPEAAPVCW